MSGGGDKDDDELWERPSSLIIAREEAHRVVDNQIKTLNDIDAKAGRILRINLLLIGILLTGLSIAAPRNPNGFGLISLSELDNIYNFIGIVCLLLSTGFAALTYTSSSSQAGMAAEELRNIIENDFSDLENIEGLVISYSNYIRYNRFVNSKNAPLGTLTLIFLVFGITALSLGVKQAVTSTVEYWILVVVGILLLAFLRLTGIYGQVKRLYRLSRISERIEGLRERLSRDGNIDGEE